ncbi:hypothetical protein NW759_003232 [Fusarium solani]|nr:hypothetical protein NW759_003232 [Fusarium solani]
MTTTTPWPDADASRRWHCGLLHLPLTLGFGGSHKLVASSAPVNGDKEMKGPYALPSRSPGRIDPAEFSFADYEAKDYLRVDLVASG